MGIRGEGFNDLKTAEDELIAHALSRRVKEIMNTLVKTLGLMTKQAIWLWR